MIIGERIDKIVIDAPAKINLFLYVLGRRDDGYHEIFSLMQAVDLADTLEVVRASRFSLEIFGISDVRPDENNTISKAREVLSHYIGGSVNVAVRLYKKIPVGAGLGGGSSDAASFMLAVNRLMNLNLTRDELIDLGAKVGSDVPFFFGRGTAIVRGRGEVIEDIELPVGYKILLVVPKFRKVSTKAMYSNLKKFLTPPEIFYKISSFNFWEILPGFSNSFVDVLGEVEPRYIDWLCHMKSIGADLALPTGSGVGYFGIFRDESKAVVSALCDFDGDVFLLSAVKTDRN